MLHFLENGVLQEFEVFDSSNLPSKIDALPFFHHHLNLTERMIDRGIVGPDILKALRRAVKRSKRIEPVLRMRTRLRAAIDRYA